MKDRRKTPRKNWVISKDEVGRSVLEWQPDPVRAKRMESDPLARTYNFLNRLDHPELEIEDDGKKRSEAFNPYDHEAPSSKRKRGYE